MGDLERVEAVEVPGVEVEEVPEPGEMELDVLDERQPSGSESSG